MAPSPLLVLDLNGVLLDRRPAPLAGQPPAAVIARTHVYVRPHARDFVAWALRAGARVGVWTSAMPRNAEVLVETALGRDWPRSLLFLLMPMPMMMSFAPPSTVNVLSIRSRLRPASVVKRFTSETFWPLASHAS